LAKAGEKIISDITSMNKRSILVKNFKEADILLERAYINNLGDLVI